jgi:hypothetical protein
MVLFSLRYLTPGTNLADSNSRARQHRTLHFVAEIAVTESRKVQG